MKQTLPDNPLELFNNWLNQARKSEINDPDAMALATASKDAKPSARMVLLKQTSEKGFKFHTNSESQKGIQLAENQFAALCFHWKSLRKQIRIEGTASIASKEEADDYFENRPYNRKIGAWASQQTRPLESREKLEQQISALEAKYPEDQDIPRPAYWNGYWIKPDSIEFWWDNPDRLHDRFIYTKNEKGLWDIQRLYP